MSKIILPDNATLSVDPDVMETSGVPEIYADGAVISHYGEDVRITTFREVRIGSVPTYRQNGLIIMRRSGFDMALYTTAARILPKMGLH